MKTKIIITLALLITLQMVVSPLQMVVSPLQVWLGRVYDTQAFGAEVYDSQNKFIGEFITLHGSTFMIVYNSVDNLFISLYATGNIPKYDTLYYRTTDCSGYAYIEEIFPFTPSVYSFGTKFYKAVNPSSVCVRSKRVGAGTDFPTCEVISSSCQTKFCMRAIKIAKPDFLIMKPPVRIRGR